MSLAQWAFSVAQQGDRRAKIFELMAFLGRYAHQPFGDMKGMTLRELNELGDATAQIIREEKAQMDPHN